MILGNKTVIRRRFAAGTWTAGKYTPGATTDLTVTDASIQPASGKVLQRLDEGDRTRDVRTLRSRTEFRPVDQNTDTLADHVIFQGETFEVNMVLPHISILNYYEVTIIKIDESD